MDDLLRHFLTLRTKTVETTTIKTPFKELNIRFIYVPVTHTTLFESKCVVGKACNTRILCSAPWIVLLIAFMEQAFGTMN